ncbi:hypothetical protein [Niveispirillum sp. KHB5.9]|uniref:hypothetical protein n=1 Tax=Niveispirillum sp. KHB5.9 TaxID=3400269 RepID=UPI003A87A74D
MATAAASNVNIGSLFARLDLDAGDFITGLRTATQGMGQARKAATGLQQAGGRTSNVLTGLGRAFSALHIGEIAAMAIEAGEGMTVLNRRLTALTGAAQAYNGQNQDAAETFSYLRAAALGDGSSKQPEKGKPASPPAAKQPEDPKLQQLLSLVQRWEEAKAALIELYSGGRDGDKFKYGLQKELGEVAGGKRDPEAVIHAGSDADIRGMAVEGMRRDARQETAAQMLQGDALSDRQYRQDLERLLIVQNAVKIAQGGLLAEQMKSEILKEQAAVLLDQARAAELLKRTRDLEFKASEEGMKQYIEDKQHEVKLNAVRLEQHAQLLKDPSYIKGQYQNSLRDMEQEGEENSQTAALMMGDPDKYAGAAFQKANGAEQMALAEMYYQYSMGMEERLLLARAEGIEAFATSMSTAISSILTGQASIGEAFSGMMSGMLNNIINFFAQWVAQWIAAQLIQWAFGKAMQAASVASAAGQATAMTAIWATPATLASIATFGGAVAEGTLALFTGVGASMATLMSFQAASTAASAGVGVAHKGGIFGEEPSGGWFSFDRPIRPNEGLALLEKGELIIPVAHAAAAAAAMAALGVPTPEGVFHEGGVFRGSLSTAGDYIDRRAVGAMSASRVEMVNYFSFDQVEAHLRRNPAAILNVMAEDVRNRGTTTRRIRGNK